MPVPVTRAQIWWKWLDSNQRSPGGRALYRRVQLPLCDTSTLAVSTGLEPVCPEGTLV
jgi:hypothetical protein